MMHYASKNTMNVFQIFERNRTRIKERGCCNNDPVPQEISCSGLCHVPLKEYAYISYLCPAESEGPSYCFAGVVDLEFQPIIQLLFVLAASAGSATCILLRLRREPLFVCGDKGLVRALGKDVANTLGLHKGRAREYP